MQDRKYLDKATECAQWLLKNSYTKEWKSWGLPFKYKCVPAFSPYLLTTVFVGDFLLNYFHITNDEEILKVVLSIADYLFENYYVEEAKSYFVYSLHSCLSYNIYNATSLALGFLSNLKEYLSFRNLEKLEKVYNTLLSSQIKYNIWGYSDDNNLIDLLHSVYTIEGLLEYSKNLKDDNLDVIYKAYKFTKKFFITKNGFCIRTLPRISKLELKELLSYIKRIIKYKVKLFTSNDEARLWGYAAALRLGVKMGNFDLAFNILNFVKNNLFVDEGYFKYKSSDSRIFIRHEAHIFEAISLLFYRAKGGEMSEVN